MNEKNFIISQNEEIKAQNKALQTELRQVKNDYKSLNAKYEVALKDYDDLLQSIQENVPDCKNCENDLMLKLSDAEIKCDRLQWYYDTLNKALDIKDELNKALREENEVLKNKLRREE